MHLAEQIKALGLCLVLLTTLPVRAEALTVVANVDRLAVDSQATVAKILRGEIRNWQDGTAIKVVLPSRSSASYRRFSELFFDVGDSDIQRHWLAMVFSGRAAPPQFEESEQEAVEYVRNTPGSLVVLLGPPPSELPGLRVRVIE